QVEQPFSFSAMLRMSAARAVSREEKDILRIESMIGRASKDVMSMCSTVLASSSAFVFLRDFVTGLTDAALAGAALLAVVFVAGFVAMGDSSREEGVNGRRPAQSRESRFGGGI